MRLNKIRRCRDSNGFTIIELLVVIILVVILVACALPVYLNICDYEHISLVKANMHIAQMAAEAYATELGGVYPPSADDPAYLSFFPDGSRDVAGTRHGHFPVNPFSHRSEMPQSGTVVDVEAERLTPPKKLGRSGQIFYSAIKDADGTSISSYAIQGAGKEGIALAGVGTERTLVLSKSPRPPQASDKQ